MILFKKPVDLSFKRDPLSAAGGQIRAVQAAPLGHRGGSEGRGRLPSYPPAQLFLSLCLCFVIFVVVYFIFIFVFPPPFLSLCVRVCLCPSGPPLRCSSASSTPPEQSPSPIPSPPANEGPGRLLGNGAAQPAADSDSEEEFVPNSFLVKSGSGNLCVAADGEWLFLSLSLYIPTFLAGLTAVRGDGGHLGVRMCRFGLFWEYC